MPLLTLVAVFVAVNAASRFVDVRRCRVTAAAYHFVAVTPLFSLRRRRRVTAAASCFVAPPSHFRRSSRFSLLDFFTCLSQSVITTCCEGDGWKNPTVIHFNIRKRLWRLEEDLTSDDGGNLATTDGSFQRSRRSQQLWLKKK
ncbi:hypothetical protein LWI29_019777 [Acer saccharum]|uniref:Secreted protein n=1 Tax=Acer saccharum TaxID=4024 RepID=A0AA39SY09_ACESA|nr:hypothetical protein LWI29_019777 [Acer saccharum]